MIHPATELRFINQEKGYGVVAKEFIPMGTITWVLDDLDREFTPEQFMELGPEYQKILDTYTFRNNKGNLVLCWDHGRFVNHSFNSNCLTTAYDFEIAIRDIQAGEELTDDYGYLNIPYAFKAADEGTRRKYVYPDDLARYHPVWDKKLLRAFKYVTKREQQLRPIIKDVVWQKVERINKGEAIMDSILNNFYPSKNGLVH